MEKQSILIGPVDENGTGYLNMLYFLEIETKLETKPQKTKLFVGEGVL